MSKAMNTVYDMKFGKAYMSSAQYNKYSCGYGMSCIITVKIP